MVAGLEACYLLQRDFVLSSSLVEVLVGFSFSVWARWL